ncbi:MULTISPECIES: CsbD family protein [Rhodovulum]|uniref:Uncharacterized protein YjbJ (UPF0337 family) n=2 Tax=Rhodovulum TaxID=34008 RepID=A0A8E2VJC4_9RHOB|nr:MULTISPECIES: PqqD family peptide modification chaperone [Rhodovulum]PTW49654.1 uncharacterized protein YjbJ (UPF0337 family) [Rhodovulum kholense]RAP41182.1 hypothetical protein BYZ73_10895 [Rhodovulum viride]
MNTDIIQGKWKQIKGRAREAWGALTDDELDRTEGDREQLVGLVQERYGKAREEAEREVDEFLSKFN